MARKKSKIGSDMENPVKSKMVKDGGKLNPFEMHVNKAKFTVLGQKSKDDWGLPGISRAKANKMREKTLLIEYKDRHKSNTFKDKRIGENNASMDVDKKIILRMAAEKKHQLSKKSIFNLNEDEELTHGGRALSDENMKDDLSDDDDEDDFLDAKFVKEKHFGGGNFLTKSTSDPAATQKTRKEFIDEIIADSKKKKYESKKEKADQEEAVSNLNAKYSDFLSLMSGKNLTEEDKEKSKKECEFRDYDILVLTLMVERDRKAPATDRLKTSEELAQEEKEKLERMEEARHRRMRGEVEDNAAGRSADSIEDGFLLESKFSKTSISYSDGIMNEPSGDHGMSGLDPMAHKKNMKYDIETPKSNNKNGVPDHSDIEDDDSVEGKSEGEDSSNEDSEEDKYSDILEQSDCGNEDIAENGESDEENEEESCEDNEDTDDNDVSEDDEAHNTDNKESSGNDKENKKDSLVLSESERRRRNENFGKTFLNRKKGRVKFLDRERIIEEAKKEIPYTFQVPEEYEDFWSLFEGRSTQDCSIILTRMIACNHPKLGGKTQGKSIKIFNYLLQVLHVICSPDPDTISEESHPLSYVDTLIPFLFNLVQLSPSATAESIVQVVDEKYNAFCQGTSRKYPFIDTFIFLKVSGLLFPASDAYHRVTTRVIAFLAQILAEAKVRNRRDILALLFTSSTLFECISRSRRFIGELSNSLKGLIYLSIPSSPDKLTLPHIRPFSRLGVESDLLVLENSRPIETPPKLKLTLASLNEESEVIDDEFRAGVFHQSVILLQKLTSTWSTLPSVHEIFKPVKQILQAVELNKYPQETTKLVDHLIKNIECLSNKGKPLVKREGRPVALKMVEPQIEDVFYGNNNKAGLSKAKLETQKLIAKVKREQKGAKRELKRDAQFLAREKHKEEGQRDAERKRKVNIIMGGLATQEHEHKKFKKT